jgi:hypothetical protein
VQPVGDQSGRADRAPGPDPVPGGQLVAGEPDHRRHRNRRQVGHRPRVRQPGKRFISGQRRGRRDDNDDHNPGQVLGPSVAVGVAAGRRAPAHHERDPQRHRGQGVGGVVQRVTQQRHRAGDGHHRYLEQRGATECGKGDPQRPDARGAGLHRRIHLAGGIVGMRAQHMPEPSGHSRPAGMVMSVPVGVTWAVANPLIAHDAQDA